MGDAESTTRGSTPDSEYPTVKSLSQQCLHYIAMHLEEFPVSQLSLLPVKIREELLWRLPIADLCQLEDSEFVTGIQDIAAYWKKPCEGVLGLTVPEIKDPDIAEYVEEWDETEYAKASLHGQVATVAIGCQGEDCFFTLPNDQLQEDNDVKTFLYGVRTLDNRKCDLVFPPRYSHQKSRKDVDATMSCFNGKYPQVFSTIRFYNEVDDDMKLLESLNNAHLLKHAMYIGIHGQPFDGFGLEFLRAVLNESAFGHLEVLVLEGLCCDLDERVSLDDLCVFLSYKQTFLSKFRLLKILTSMLGHGYVVSQGIFDELIKAYFSAPTDHAQKLHLRDAKIMCDCGHHDSLSVDQQFLQFKTIELDNCKFITKAQATPKSISHWLGQDISVLENNKGSCTFKVKEKVSKVGQKRKFSEIVYDN